ncbi:MAG: hypothetical protein KJ587_12130 [Alphaproteobacteria bacterium]|nr:hypothetical protein [Alphaproteobacteria bacterium]
MKPIVAAFHWLAPRARFLQRLQGSILVSPLLIMGAICLFLAFNKQIAELLIFVVEPQNERCAIHLGAGFIAMTLLAVVVFYGYLSGCVVLRKTGIGYGSSLFYKEAVELHRDRKIVWYRNALALACAVAPLAVIHWVFQTASGYAGLRQVAAAPQAGTAAPWLPERFCALNADALPQHLSQVGNVWLVLSLLVALALHLTAQLSFDRRQGARRLSWRSTRTRQGRTIAALAMLVLMAPVPLMFAAANLHEALYLWLGPLATLGLVMMATAWLLFVVAEGSKRSGIPFFLIAFIVVFGIGLLKWASPAPLPELAADLPTPKERDEQKQKALTEAERQFAATFKDWLDARRPPGSDRAYPVYIVAAPGGGIYAANYVAGIMARLEDDCPGFSEHVFAISAVSGGAIGATLLNAATHGRLRKSAVDCSGATRDAARSNLLKTVLSADHLSPTIASTVPDILLKLGQIVVYEAPLALNGILTSVGFESYFDPDAPDMSGGRAEALELSFSQTWNRAASSLPISRDCKSPCDPLNETTAEYWKPGIDAAPALILNTTWAETGNRIAYAPFALKGIGDGSLERMSDLDGRPARLIEAAVASARFPAILPAKVLNPQQERKLWWNFVDGGYADASGTTTALEVYNALKRISQAGLGQDVDLKLLIITETGSEDTTRSQSGSGLVHAISPITTLLTIREQISRRAVLRAVSDLAEYPRTAIEGQPGCWQAMRLVADPADLKLPLGWLLARSTVEAIDEKLQNDNSETLAAIKQNLTGNDTCTAAQKSAGLATAGTK